MTMRWVLNLKNDVVRKYLSRGIGQISVEGTVKFEILWVFEGIKNLKIH